MRQLRTGEEYTGQGLAERAVVILDAITAGGEIVSGWMLRRELGTADLNVRIKESEGDLVTAADEESQGSIIGIIKGHSRKTLSFQKRSEKNTTV